MLPQPQPRQEIGRASLQHDRIARARMLSMGIPDSSPELNPGLNVDGQGMLENQGYKHYCS